MQTIIYGVLLGIIALLYLVNRRQAELLDELSDKYLDAVAELEPPEIYPMPEGLWRELQGTAEGDDACQR